jgi:hypothetical protein
MVTEFNKTFVGHQSRQVVEHCSTTYGYASAKQYFVLREQCICYSQTSHNLAKAKLYSEAS